jgi:hypothetical protein
VVDSLEINEGGRNRDQCLGSGPTT